jgi:hypothetical protein
MTRNGFITEPRWRATDLLVVGLAERGSSARRTGTLSWLWDALSHEEAPTTQPSPQSMLGIECPQIPEIPHDGEAARRDPIASPAARSNPTTPFYKRASKILAERYRLMALFAPWHLRAAL